MREQIDSKLFSNPLRAAAAPHVADPLGAVPAVQLRRRARAAAGPLLQRGLHQHDPDGVPVDPALPDGRRHHGPRAGAQLGRVPEAAQGRRAQLSARRAYRVLGPATEFVRALYVDFDFEEAQRQSSRACRGGAARRLLPRRGATRSSTPARHLISESYCKIHARIDISGPQRLSRPRRRRRREVDRQPHPRHARRRQDRLQGGHSRHEPLAQLRLPAGH